jgi:hypothetical protein
MQVAPEVVILEIAGEGGGITILGRQNADRAGWEFARKMASDNWLLLEEGETPNSEYKEPPLEWKGSWDEAIGLIDRYPWAMLIPLEVHPEFKQDVLLEVTRRLTGGHPKYAWVPEDSKESAMERWQSKCG